MKFSNKIILVLLALMLPWRAAASDAAKFSGTVVDAQGGPVAGATVGFYQYPTHISSRPVDMEEPQHTTTDGQGAFEFPTFSGMGLVLVTKPGGAPTWRTWYAAPQGPQKIVLTATATLAGTVVDAEGQPVADAEVWVSAALNKTLSDLGQPNFVFGKIARGLFSTRTAADGKFRLDNFPADAQAVLAVKKTGEALRPAATSFRYDQLPFHAGAEDITLTLEPAGTVKGKVVVRATGQPLANAVVGLEPAAQGMNFLSNPAGSVSAADGSFQISDVPAGDYQVTIDFTNQPMADWVAEPVPVKVAAGETAPEVQVQADKGGVLALTVRGKGNHELLADVSVGANNQSAYNRSGATGTNGTAVFRLPAGQYFVYANKPAWSQAQSQATVTEGQTTSIAIELAAPFKITGVVLDDTGAPLADASVGVYPNYGNGNAGGNTDANGHYEVTWQKPSYVGMQNQIYHLVARSTERKLAGMAEVQESTTNLNLTLQPAMSVSGQVQDAGGKPITNALASISLQLENSGFGITRQPVNSDAHGRILAEALPRGQRYDWYVTALGYGSGREAMDAADPKADHYDFPPLVLKLADHKLAGRVLDAKGAPAVGAQIYLQGDGQPNGNAVSDADGRFAFDAVCAGPLTVSANMKGAYDSADAMGGDTNVVIRFEAGNRSVMMATPQTLTGTVFDPAGKPAVDVRVVVTPSWGQIDNTKTDANGDFSVTWQQQPGMGIRDAKYFVIARDVERNLVAIESLTTNKTRVSLRLGPGLSILGTAQDAQGAPLTRANVNLNMMAGNMGGMVEYEPIKLASDGTFTIPALPMGQQYFVNVSAKGFGSANKNVSKTQSRTNSIVLKPFKLRIADRPLAGQVLGADGKPLAGAQVSINGDNQPYGNMRSDENGHFHFTVCPGPIRIFAWSQSGSGRNNSGSAQADGGDKNVVLKMGVQQQRPEVMRETPLKPQPWTFAGLLAWPANHRTGMIVLLSVQGAVLLGTAGGVFWHIRKRRL